VTAQKLARAVVTVSFTRLSWTENAYASSLRNSPMSSLSGPWSVAFVGHCKFLRGSEPGTLPQFDRRLQFAEFEEQQRLKRVQSLFPQRILGRALIQLHERRGQAGQCVAVGLEIVGVAGDDETALAGLGIDQPPLSSTTSREELSARAAFRECSTRSTPLRYVMAALAISTMNSTRRPIAGFSVSSQLRTIQPDTACRTDAEHISAAKNTGFRDLEFRSSVFIGLQHAFDFVARIADFDGPSALDCMRAEGSAPRRIASRNAYAMRSSASASRLFEHSIFSALDLARLQSCAAGAGTGAASTIATAAATNSS